MRAVRKQFKRPRWLAALLCICIILPYLNGFTLSAPAQPEEGQEGLCEHHPAHTKECGFEEARQEQPCGHQHDETCGYAPAQPEVPCDMNCGQENPGEGGNNLENPEAPETPEGPAQPEEEAPEGGAPDGGETAPDSEEEDAAETPDQDPVEAQPEPDQEKDSEELPEDQTPLNQAPALHRPDCAYRPAQPEGPCAHQHDEQCGYQPAQPASPCGFACEKCREDCVQSWEYLDEEGVLVFSEDANLWGLAAPGANQENPLTAEALAAMLPAQIHAQLGGGKEADLPLTWDLSAIPQEGLWQGLHTLRASLPQDYRLAQDAPAIAVLLAVGDGEIMEGEIHKYVSKWEYVADGYTFAEEKCIGEPFKYSTDIYLAKPLTQEKMKELLAEKLPKAIHGQGYVSSNDRNLINAGFQVDKGQPATGQLWGTVKIEWEISLKQEEYHVGDKITLFAQPVSNPGYVLRINANNGEKGSAHPENNNEYMLDSDNNDTSERRDVLNLTITLKDLELAFHTVPSVEPENVTVNLFDYWVEDYGQNPSVATGGDILQKSDSHKTAFADANGGATTEWSTRDDWYKGINKGHLLLFGDGLIHAGLWNKGAGSGTEYGQKYAGMEGIVQRVLVDHFPALNLKAAKSQLKETLDGSERDYTKVGDYKLAGEHTPGSEGKYEGAIFQNLSDTLLGVWSGDLNGTESLNYLFDPNVTNNYKKSYTDIKGLFQLDGNGYYYYNMRENFAEFQENGAGGGRFVLYDQPATWRTDHDKNPSSIGNFFPFNKGEEVFNGLDEDNNLMSSMAPARNAMNHHLGMTVEVDFRQPSNGKIKMGSGESEPMTFGFSGDDDVWIFVDDVLVLDIGGIHSELYGTIDFSTGEVFIGQAFNTKGVPTDPGEGEKCIVKTDLKTLYDKAIEEAEQSGVNAEKAKAVKWTTWKDETGEYTTFASNSVHTLKMFYLERGNYDSSIALRFNLQPLLYQQIKKVDQNGDPLQGAEFELYEALEDANGSVVGTNGDAKGLKYKAGTERLATLTSGADGVDQFVAQDSPSEGKSTAADRSNAPLPFNFADRTNEFYILREKKSPEGYRKNPVDILLQYHHDTDTITVVNRWTTGVVSSFTNHIAGNANITYGAFNINSGDIEDSGVKVPEKVQKDGLIMAVPMVKVQNERPQAKGQESPEAPEESDAVGRWKAMYGSNLSGYHVVTPAHRAAEDWRKALLKAALYQCVGSVIESSEGHTFSQWYLQWNNDAHRIEGKLEELPGMAEEYQFNYSPGTEKFKNAKMKMAYAIVAPEALKEVGVSGNSDKELYESMAQVAKNWVDKPEYQSAEDAIDALVDEIYAVKGTTPGEAGLETEEANKRGVSFLNVGQFTQNAQSMIYIPNEQRELRVWKVDQNGQGVNDVTFGLYRDKACTGEPVSSGITACVDGRDGVLIFSPEGKDTPGHAETVWADADEKNQTDYYLKEISAPEGYALNTTVIPVKVGQYSIYADAGQAGDGVKVMASVGKLAQTMLRFAISEDMDITLRDITAFAQSQDSGNFQLGAEHWKDVNLRVEDQNAPDIPRFMHLHYGENATVDYGLHDVDGGENLYPVFVTDEGYLRARVEQNWPALNNQPSLGGAIYGDAAKNTANKEELENVDITNLFSLINVVVVTDEEEKPTERTGQLAISKTVEGNNLGIEDYTKLFSFKVELTGADGNGLNEDFQYYFYGEDKSGHIANGETVKLHHDERIVILGLPEGTRWKATEIEQAGWHPTPVSGVISGEISADEAGNIALSQANFTNRKEPSLEIRKTIVEYDETTDKDAEFRFTVALKNDRQEMLTGEFAYVKFNAKGEQSETGAIQSGGAVTLKHGESVVIRNLPAGTQCVVTEEPAEGWNPQDPAAGQIQENASTTISFANSRKGTPPEEPQTGSLTIEKTVDSAIAGDLEQTFAFIVTLMKDGKELEGEFSYDGDRTGTMKSGDSILLRHSQKITIRSLPIGVRFTVKEQKAEGWKEQEDQTGIIAKTGSQAAFVNQRRPNIPPPTPSGPDDPDDDEDDPPPTPPKDPEKPQEPEDPKPPVTPEDPENPGTPENPPAPESPEEPAPPAEPDYPTELPDPNDPDSPEEITIWEDGVPTTYIKVWDPEEEEWEYIPEDEVPLDRRWPDNPKTGDSRRLELWLALSAAALAGMALTAKRIRRK